MQSILLWPWFSDASIHANQVKFWAQNIVSMNVRWMRRFGFCSVSVLSFNFVNGLLSRSTLSKPWPSDTFYETDEDWVMFEVCGILSSLKSTTSLPPTPSSGISRGPHFAKVQQQPWTRYPVATGSRHSYLMTVESPTQLKLSDDNSETHGLYTLI